jgi:UDP-glucose 4-epimerase
VNRASKILITGGGGFIGRNLVESYSAKYDVSAPRRAELDLLDAVEVRRYLGRHEFDVVIHAATERSNRAVGEGTELLNRNCRMFFNLARNHDRFGKMLFLSSGAVYDRAHWEPRMPEAYFDCHVPADDYGFSKYICAKAAGDAGNIHELRLFGVFGRYEDWRVRFISNACCRAVWNLPLFLRQNTFFDYLAAEDLACILELFLSRRPLHREYNVCTGRISDLRSLANLVLQASGKKLEIVVGKPGFGREYGGDNRRLLQEFPSICFQEMSDSIANLYAWYLDRKAEIDPAALRFDE